MTNFLVCVAYFQFSEATNNPLRYTKMAKNIPSTTRFVSLDLYNENGTKFAVENISQGLVVKIPRASDMPRLSGKYVE